MTRVEVIDPVAPFPGNVKQAAPRIADLRGKVIGVRSYWPNFFVFVERIQERLRSETGVGDVRIISVEEERANRMHTQTRTSATAMPSSVDALSPQKYAAFAQGIDTAISGLAA